MSELNRINNGHGRLEGYFKNLYTQSFNNSWQTKMNSAQTLKEELTQLKKTLKEQQAKVREVEQCQGRVDAIRKELTERQIPMSLQARRNEVAQLVKRHKSLTQKLSDISRTHGQPDARASTSLQEILRLFNRI